MADGICYRPPFVRFDAEGSHADGYAMLPRKPSERRCYVSLER